MKVTFKYGIKTFSGTIDEMVYGSFRDDNLCIGREYVYPKITDNNHEKGESVKNLALVYHEASPDYIQDLKTYATRYGKTLPKDKLLPTAFALFIKMMYAWQASDPTHVDLKAVTIADIVALDADVRTIARAVDAEFLPYVSVSDDLINEIQ